MEYKKICKEFLKNKKYKKMLRENHHGTSRLEHINRVAKISYRISKLFRLNYISTTRGALMHDFFLNSELESLNLKRFKIHSQKAYENSLKHFKVNDLEKNIILSHMYPIVKELPKSKEAHVVNISDKIVSIYEFCRFQIKYTTVLLMIFSIETINNAIMLNLGL